MNLSRLHAEKQKSYVERYKDAFKEEPSTPELPQLLKSNEYLRECLRDLNSLISKKIDKQKEKIFSRYQKEDIAPKKSESQIIEEQLLLLERDYQNNNFIFTQQERELRQLDERLSGISSTQHFELVGQIENLNDEIRKQRMECNSQKYFNFKEGKYLDSNSQLPKIVEVQQNTSLDALKLQRENERIKDLTKKKEDLMMEYAKKIQIVDKKYKIANSKQFEEIDENLAKRIAEEKKKSEGLQNNIDIVIKNFEREQQKHKQATKDIGLIEKHTDDKVNALELQIRQLNADIQQLQDLAKEVAPNQSHPSLSQSELKPNQSHPSLSQSELKMNQNQEENEKQSRVTPLKPVRNDVLDQSTHKEIESSQKKKIANRSSGSKNNPEPISIPVKQTKPKAEMHSVSIQQTPTDQKQQGEQQQFFPSQNQPKNQKESEEGDEKGGNIKSENNKDKNDLEEDNGDHDQKLNDSLHQDDQDKKHKPDQDDSAIFNPKNKQNDKNSTHKIGEQEEILGSQLKKDQPASNDKEEDKEDDENLDDIEAEIRQLEQQEEEQKQQNAINEQKEEKKKIQDEQLNHKEQTKLQPLTHVNQKVSSDSQTGGQHSDYKVMIPNKTRESISKIDDKIMSQDHQKTSQENFKNSNQNLPSESKNEGPHSKNELTSQIIYNESTERNQGVVSGNIKEIENKNAHEQVQKTKLMPLQGSNIPNKSDSKLNTQKDQQQQNNHDSDIDIDDLLDDNNNKAPKQVVQKQQPSVKEIADKKQQSGTNIKNEHKQQQHQETKQQKEDKDVWEELSDF